jgi:hypothetical protein
MKVTINEDSNPEKRPNTKSKKLLMFKLSHASSDSAFTSPFNVTQNIPYSRDQFPPRNDCKVNPIPMNRYAIREPVGYYPSNYPNQYCILPNPYTVTMGTVTMLYNPSSHSRCLQFSPLPMYCNATFGMYALPPLPSFCDTINNPVTFSVGIPNKNGIVFKGKNISPEKIGERLAEQQTSQKKLSLGSLVQANSSQVLHPESFIAIRKRDIYWANKEIMQDGSLPDENVTYLTGVMTKKNPTLEMVQIIERLEKEMEYIEGCKETAYKAAEYIIADAFDNVQTETHQEPAIVETQRSAKNVKRGRRSGGGKTLRSGVARRTGRRAARNQLA